MNPGAGHREPAPSQRGPRASRPLSAPKAHSEPEGLDSWIHPQAGSHDRARGGHAAGGGDTRREEGTRGRRRGHAAGGGDTRLEGAAADVMNSPAAGAATLEGRAAE